MPTIAGRQRPIEKFAEAVGKCGVEVSGHIYSPVGCYCSGTFLCGFVAVYVSFSVSECTLFRG
jgi:hypothetical protein